MRIPWFRWLTTVGVLVVLFLSGAAVTAASSSNLPYKVLVFSKTVAFRHASIPNGLAAIQQLGLENNFQVVATEDATLFNAACPRASGDRRSSAERPSDL